MMKNFDQTTIVQIATIVFHISSHGMSVLSAECQTGAMKSIQLAL